MRTLRFLWDEWTLTPTHKELLPKMCCRCGRRLREIMVLAGDRALTDQASMEKAVHDGAQWLAYDTLVPFRMNAVLRDGNWVTVGSKNERANPIGVSIIHGHEPRVYSIEKPESDMLVVGSWEFARLLHKLPLQKNPDPDWTPLDVRQFIDGYLSETKGLVVRISRE